MDYELHPPGGPFPGVLAEIRLHENVETAFGTKDRLQFTFQSNQLLRDHTEGIDDDQPMTVVVFVNATLSDKGRLMTYLTQQVPAAELKSLLAASEVDVEQLLLGTQWMLSVEHNEANGRVYANISNAMKAPDAQRLAIWEEGL